MSPVPAVRRVLAARFISRTGGEAAFVVGIWGKAAYELEAGPSGIAVLMAALGIAGLIGSTLSGPLIDRFGPRGVLVASELVLVPVTLSAILASTLSQLTVAGFLIGLAGFPAYAAIAAFPRFVAATPGGLTRVNAGVEAATMAAVVAGPAVGAAIVAGLSVDAIFVFDAATSLVGAALVVGIGSLPGVGREAPAGPAPSRMAVAAGFTVIRRHPRLRFTVGAGAGLWLSVGIFSALEPLFYRDVLGRGPEVLGAMNVLFGLGLVSGSALLPRVAGRIRSARGIAALLVLNGVTMTVYVGTRSLVVVGIGLAAWGLVVGVFSPLVRTMIHLDTPADMAGRVTGAALAVTETAKLLPLAVAPGLAAATGVQPALVIAGAALVVTGGLAWPPARRVDGRYGSLTA